VDSSSLQGLLAEYAELESQLADPAVHADAGRARKLGRRYAELAPVVKTIGELDTARDDLAAARELAGEDTAFAEEAEQLAEHISHLEAKLTHLLLPRDPYDASDVVMEIKSGEGGEESALFAGDLLRMYVRYAEKQGWKAIVLDSVDSDLGGFKEVIFSISGPEAYRKMKYESGAHRVHRADRRRRRRVLRRLRAHRPLRPRPCPPACLQPSPLRDVTRRFERATQMNTRTTSQSTSVQTSGCGSLGPWRAPPNSSYRVPTPPGASRSSARAAARSRKRSTSPRDAGPMAPGPTRSSPWPQGVAGR
jgi:hypothetical protein